MDKDLVIGAFEGYNFQQLKPWIYSLKETGFSGDIVLIGIEVDPHTKQQIENSGVNVVQAAKMGKVHMARFLYTQDFIRKSGHKYRFVVSTDVRDVVFQRNPSMWLEEEFNRSPFEIIASSEAITIKNEPWNCDNIRKNYGDYFLEIIKSEAVLNVGVIAGLSHWMQDLCMYIWQMAINRPDWVADQAAYNLLINTRPWSNHTRITELRSGWALNAHVTNKPDQLEQFGPYLLEPRPYMNKENKIVNEAGMPFVIVHQYDRVPEWKTYFEEWYK